MTLTKEMLGCLRQKAESGDRGELVDALSPEIVLALLERLDDYREALLGIATMRGNEAERCAPGDALAALKEQGDAP